MGPRAADVGVGPRPGRPLRPQDDFVLGVASASRPGPAARPGGHRGGRRAGAPMKEAVPEGTASFISRPLQGGGRLWLPETYAPQVAESLSQVKTTRVPGCSAPRSPMSSTLYSQPRNPAFQSSSR